jgi:hypothetical protein
VEEFSASFSATGNGSSITGVELRLSSSSKALEKNPNSESSASRLGSSSTFREATWKQVGCKLFGGAFNSESLGGRVAVVAGMSTLWITFSFAVAVDDPTVRHARLCT